MLDQRVERIRHVPVAQVPGGHLIEEHRAVVGLGVRDHAGVLLGIEELVVGHRAAAPRVIGRPAPQFDQLADDLLLARLGQVQVRHEAIDLGLLTEAVETGVAFARLFGRFRVDLLEIMQHSFHRRVQAVKVEAVKPDLGRAWRKRIVVRA